MELMSSLLFCALVAHLPQAFGESSTDLEIKSNNSKEFQQIPMPKTVLLNIGPPLMNPETVFTDVICSQCMDCMARAIVEYQMHDQINETTAISNGLHEQELKMDNRNKRESDTNTTEKVTTKTKRNKSKKSKSVTVTKYNVDGEVYAIKVKETNTTGSVDQQNDTQVTTCQIFSVKKSFPCDTAEVESFLSVAKRKINKKNKKEKNSIRKGAASTSKLHFMAPVFRKRQVDNSQIPDSFMPSIEDLY